MIIRQRGSFYGETMMIYIQMIETEEERDDFEKMYLEYRNLMFFVANRILNNEQDAEDAVHHAFIKIAGNMKKIEAPVCPKTKSYVVTIVENHAIDILRKKNRHPDVGFHEEAMGYPVEYHGENEVAACILKLPIRYREVILLKYVHGYDCREIASLLNISEANERKLEQRAKRKLKEMCEQEEILC